ncbi:hydrocephalus-inducing protein homolog [Chiroxiphia lanceolata]|uniref:hydrocephalus-inducing protein homolog n=1 Tax=Chiroxiphia lanceolata TaxID=296741 RepID=UPI0013CE7EDF|nr:hydrocephalus-inducing protein homolog [Chiroxiphia lanceolata]
MAGEQGQLRTAPGRAPRRSLGGHPSGAPGAALEGRVGPGTLRAAGLRRAASGAAERGWDGRAAMAPRRGRPWPREGRAWEQRPVLGAPGAGQRAALGQVTRLVKVTMDSSPYFKLVGPNDVCHQIPPGSFCTINILFTPEGSKDHFHQLVCSSEREKVSVPIRATGARPVLDFPDQLDFSSCPVNHSTQKTLLVHNTGNLEACYSLSTER